MNIEAGAIIIGTGGLAIGVVAGFVMHRSDFCIAGMFRDMFLFRSFFKLRSLLLNIAATMLLFEIARLAGFLPLYPFPLLGSATLAGVAGGFIFGVGMVLAGGCVVGTLYKMGAGSVLSAVAFIGLIAGSTLYAWLHPWWSSMLSLTTLFGGVKTIPLLLGVSPLPLILIVLLLLLPVFYRWFNSGLMERPMYASGEIRLWVSALLLSLLTLASYMLVGMPMGITTAYAKTGAMLMSVVAPEYLHTLSFFTLKPLGYQNPLTGYMLAGGAGPAFDGIALVQFPLILGIIAGGAISAVSVGEFRMRFRAPARQFISVFAGGCVMGLASRMAPACNVWHIFGGMPVLAFSSILFVTGMVPGAFLGSRILEKWVIR